MHLLTWVGFGLLGYVPNTYMYVNIPKLNKLFLKFEIESDKRGGTSLGGDGAGDGEVLLALAAPFGVQLLHQLVAHAHHLHQPRHQLLLAGLRTRVFFTLII
jgi:hypothetical protein